LECVFCFAFEFLVELLGGFWILGLLWRGGGFFFWVGEDLLGRAEMAASAGAGGAGGGGAGTGAAATTRKFKLQKENELRVEVGMDAPLKLQLVNGTAEIFGTELPPLFWMTFPAAHKFAVSSLFASCSPGITFRHGCNPSD
jgi:hypothetical protein